MFIFAKLLGILSLVWFYTTAKKHGGPVINWSVTGLIGYWLTWWMVKFLVVDNLTKSIPPNSSLQMALALVPVVCGFAACFLIRNQLIASLKRAPD